MPLELLQLRVLGSAVVPILVLAAVVALTSDLSFADSLGLLPLGLVSLAVTTDRTDLHRYLAMEQTSKDGACFSGPHLQRSHRASLIQRGLAQRRLQGVKCMAQNWGNPYRFANSVTAGRLVCSDLELPLDQ